MRAFPLVLSLAAVGASAFSLVVSLGLSKELRERPPADPSLEARLAKVEEALDAASKSSSAPRTLAPLPSSRDEAAMLGDTTSALTGASSPLAAGRKPATMADLETRLAEIEKKVSEQGVNPAAAQAADGPVFAAPSIAFIHSADDAAKHLELSASQRAQFERALEDAKREIDTIRTTPDETGQTWEKAEKDVFTVQNGGFSIDGSKMSAFREKLMPGRNESFGGAMRRAREEGFRRLKSTLSPAQEEKFSKAQTDALLPGGNDLFNMFSVTVGAGDAVPVPPDASMDR